MAKSRIAVVTGGMGGLGESISTKMAGAGYRVVVTYSPANTKYRAWLEEMKGRGFSFAAFPVDVVDFDDCSRACQRIQSEIGPIDILVNNAGITRDMTFKKMTKADWDAAAKAGIHGFTKALALEVARKGVTINTISPGYIGTKMVTAIPKEILDSKILPQIPIGRLGKPEEVAGLIIYLCSEEAAFVTGANISINGGQHMY
jgi:acetoacetyl-CoA reductase